MEQEIWKPIKGFEGYYEISNLGRVKSVERFVAQGNHLFHCKEHFLSSHINNYGYYEVSLRKNGTKANKLIHRLIMEAFVPNIHNKPCIDHINGIRTDNRLCNLKWATHKENSNNQITLKKLRNSMNDKEKIRRGLISRILKHGRFAPKSVFQYTCNDDFVKEHFSLSQASISITGNVNSGGNISRYVDTGKVLYGFKWYSKRIEPTQ